MPLSRVLVVDSVTMFSSSVIVEAVLMTLSFLVLPRTLLDVIYDELDVVTVAPEEDVFEDSNRSVSFLIPLLTPGLVTNEFVGVLAAGEVRLAVLDLLDMAMSFGLSWLLLV